MYTSCTCQLASVTSNDLWPVLFSDNVMVHLQLPTTFPALFSITLLKKITTSSSRGGCHLVTVDSWGTVNNPTAKRLVERSAHLTTMLVNVRLKPNLEETNICIWYANMTVSQSSYSINSEKPQSPLCSLAWQWAEQQDLPLSRDASPG